VFSPVSKQVLAILRKSERPHQWGKGRTNGEERPHQWGLKAAPMGLSKKGLFSTLWKTLYYFSLKILLSN